LNFSATVMFLLTLISWLMSNIISRKSLKGTIPFGNVRCSRSPRPSSHDDLHPLSLFYCCLGRVSGSMPTIRVNIS
jgi:hypothetical protein